MLASRPVWDSFSPHFRARTVQQRSIFLSPPHSTTLGRKARQYIKTGGLPKCFVKQYTVQTLCEFFGLVTSRETGHVFSLSYRAPLINTYDNLRTHTATRTDAARFVTVPLTHLFSARCLEHTIIFPSLFSAQRRIAGTLNLLL